MNDRLLYKSPRPIWITLDPYYLHQSCCHEVGQVTLQAQPDLRRHQLRGRNSDASNIDKIWSTLLIAFHLFNKSITPSHGFQDKSIRCCYTRYWLILFYLILYLRHNLGFGKPQVTSNKWQDSFCNDCCRHHVKL